MEVGKQAEGVVGAIGEQAGQASSLCSRNLICRRMTKIDAGLLG